MCALAPAARALLRRLSGGLRRAGAGWARLERGSMRSGKPLRDSAGRVPLLRLSCPTLPGARRVDFRRSAAARERCGVRLGVPAARRGGFWVGAASDGAGKKGESHRQLPSFARVVTLTPAVASLTAFLINRAACS